MIATMKRPTALEGEEHSAQRLRAHGIDPDEYRRIQRILGRAPTLTELGIFSVMWSEHCAYSSSKVWLKTLPTAGKRVLVKAGAENAGVVDLGDGVAVAFKIESHNHPSAVEPHAGAATGVGGILRDIFTMGARPIALLDSLRFGSLDAPRTRFLLDGVVRGIADYGNCMGVPTVGGEVIFDPVYAENPLVNVLCVGLVPTTKIARAKARGAGNPVLYVGASTGRDGLGGAAFASREITEASNADRPAVQLGDPFTEKCLLEATLEALSTGDVVGIQDMGAAGLTCSTCETASRGGCGIEIDLALVPRRETGMTPYEVMLSESQERMLLIVQRGRERRVLEIFTRWGLQAAIIGRVTGGRLMRVRDDGRLVAEIPAAALADDAPIYRRPMRRPAYLAEARRLPSVPQPSDHTDVLRRLLDSPTIASKRWLYRQYDHMVQTNTVLRPGASCAVLRIKGTHQLLGVTTDGNGTYTYLDPYEGGKQAVAEAARNLVCAGATPLAVTNCLNFGNPEDPEIMWQLRHAIRGLSDACRAFATPVTGGNVSLYNESPQGAIDPTPVIGMIGIVEGARGRRPGAGGRRQPPPTAPRPSVVTTGFKHEGDAILLLGTTRDELGGSEYLKVIHGLKRGRPPRVSLAGERAVQRAVLAMIATGKIQSAHDCSDGGLAVTLAECCFTGERRLGATIDAPPAPRPPPLRAEAWLFGESQGRIVVSCAADDATVVARIAKRYGVPCAQIGSVGRETSSRGTSGAHPTPRALGVGFPGLVGGPRLRIGAWIDVPVDELAGVWSTAIDRRMDPRA